MKFGSLILYFILVFNSIFYNYLINNHSYIELVTN